MRTRTIGRCVRGFFVPCRQVSLQKLPEIYFRKVTSMRTHPWLSVYTRSAGTCRVSGQHAGDGNYHEDMRKGKYHGMRFLWELKNTMILRKIEILMVQNQREFFLLPWGWRNKGMVMVQNTWFCQKYVRKRLFQRSVERFRTMICSKNKGCHGKNNFWGKKSTMIEEENMKSHGKR